MTRKAFLADVKAASEKSIANISGIARGDDDGDIVFQYSTTATSITIGLLAIDVSEYPSGNAFLIFTKSPDVPKAVNEALQIIGSCSLGLRISELVMSISTRLNIVLAAGTEPGASRVEDGSDVDMEDALDDDEEGEEDEEEEDYFDHGYNDGFSDDDDGFGGFGTSAGNPSTRLRPQLAPDELYRLNRRIKEDLRALRYSGFKIGILSGMKADSATCLLSISMQAAKLGLSEEALQAWDVLPAQYIVILVKYSSGYKTFDAIISDPAKSLNISFRIGVCDKYKPTSSQALAAFTEIVKNESKSSNEQSGDSTAVQPISGVFSSIFISSSLNEFINDQFISLLKIRTSICVGWDGAKLWFNDKQGRPDQKVAHLEAKYYEESTPKQSSLPEMMCADHLVDAHNNQKSFPLIVAQFAMRYFLRCTEFCLVCHDRIHGDFEALKPYVCDKPLCLYQYMSLGFGPSIEHEILTQSTVVDLLVSFCYIAAMYRRIREYPTGMSLSVPAVLNTVTSSRAPNLHSFAPPRQDTPVTNFRVTQEPESALEVKYDSIHQELIFETGTTCPIRNGDWVVIVYLGAARHIRIEDISLYPTVKLSGDGITPRSGNGAVEQSEPTTPATTPPPILLHPAKLVLYDQNFDDLDETHKAETIVMLLDTLPSITELRAYLLSQSRTSEPNLRAWKERISPAALGMLRWIIASNRSCIVQVDKCPGQEESDPLAAKIKLDQKCSNIADGWVQFRFAQGSPDKEQRFLNALKKEQANLHALYPTMFAFHGSPLQNWHSIIRHGLDFSETLHGRAYGHGVYHALEQNVSSGYASFVTCSWPGSELKINSAMSLNEIVNCPSQFQSSSPYLVVQHVDWIQCRYLMVQISSAPDSSSALSSSTDPSPLGEIEQDPKFTVRSTLHKPVGIPLCAVNISKTFRAVRGDHKKKSSKRRKSSGNYLELNATISDEEELDDISFLFSDDEDAAVSGRVKGKVAAEPLTEFVPGSLNHATLPILDPPTYATPAATMRLTREMQTIVKIQEKTPLHEIGWYIHTENISNVYQWIVELHSFEETLPLAKDMKTAGVSSIVLEIRFGKDYPHSPPFVRVIRPRFLPFTSGGGGHVTMGGALCMELLTNSGWSAVSSIESVLLQVRLAIMNCEPRPARLMSTGSQQGDYGNGEAVDAYIRACRTHGWEVPKDFADFRGGPSSGRPEGL
ncbi:hypothetical protein B0O99DRAFT_513387 [Bisporella sp. PMI_857]|nr:hypothetical protein B0O99DRAFT_513387 [Bisporella sp. PMI_857]